MGGDQSQPLCGSLVAILKWLKLIPNRASGGSGGSLGRGFVLAVRNFSSRARWWVPLGVDCRWSVAQGLKPNYILRRFRHD